ncbi:MAG: twitching motility protein PilT [Acidobacteria bacterium RIFCSPLOWO2_12_FULL_67_14b]|nr:MAG: twitching motility protein PilT [Acidobacteria bacterium RIFCSPLOWO2_12_FULL_67_14b]
MRLLLDTHTFLWWLDGDRRLPARVRRQIGANGNTIYVSAASAWEITTKWRLGKLPGAEAVAADVGRIVASQGFSELEITIRHAEHAGRLAGDHRDPFDRMLIAQAQVEGVSIASGDEVFEEYGVSLYW